MTSAPYDGFITAISRGSNGASINIFVNDIIIAANSNADYGINGQGEVAFRKGDKLEITSSFRDKGYICFYEKRDYSNR